MPTYDYKCPMCKHTEERFATIAKRKSQGCPNCGDTLEIVPTAPALTFTTGIHSKTNEVPLDDFDMDAMDYTQAHQTNGDDV